MERTCTDPIAIDEAIKAELHQLVAAQHGIEPSEVQPTTLVSFGNLRHFS